MVFVQAEGATLCSSCRRQIPPTSGARVIWRRSRRANQRLLLVFGRSGVDTRYFVQPFEWYVSGPIFEERNRVFGE